MGALTLDVLPDKQEGALTMEILPDKPKPKPEFDDTELKSNISEMLTAATEGDKELSLSDAFVAGFQQSNIGMLSRQAVPDIHLSSDPPMANRLASQAANILTDLPLMVAGAAAGAAGGPVTALGGAFALPAGMREVLVNAYKNGSIDSFDEFFDVLTRATTEEAKGFITGAATGAVGKVVPIKPLVFPAEVATMVSVGNALQGKVPEPHEFLDAAILVGGAKASVKIVEKLHETYSKTNTRPADVVEKIEVEPTIKEDLHSNNIKTPRAFIKEAEVLESQPIVKNVEPVEPKLPSERVLERVSVKERPTKGYNLKDFYRDAVDDLFPLKKVQESIAKGEKFPIEEDFYKLARLERGTSGKADHFLEFSPFKFNTFENVGKSLKDILKGQSLDNVRAYAVSKRAIELNERGIKTGVDIKDAKQTVKDLSEYEVQFRELVEYQDHVLNYAIDSGMISKDMAKTIREANKDYVPMFRVLSDDNPGGMGRSKNPIKRIKGSERTIVDPLESIIKNTYTLIALSERNATQRAFVDFAVAREGGEVFAKKVKATMRPVKLGEKEIGKLLGDYAEDAGAKVRAEELTLFRANSLRPTQNQIEVYRDGKREVYEVDPQVADVFNKVDTSSANILIKLLSKPARLLRAGAILSPEFIARNPIRDQLSAFIFSDKGFVPFLDLSRGIFSLVKKDADYQAWIKSGGPMSMLVSLDRKYIQKNIFHLTGERGVGDIAWNIIKSPVEMLRVASEWAEAGTRIGEFKKVSGKVRSKQGILEAGFSSREVTLDFARIGAQTRAINQLVAFFNASVQGTDKMIRAFKNNPARTTAKVASAITLPSVLLYLHNRNDPEYKDLPQWQKDLFWPVKVGDTWYRIPKPFELGLLFGTGAERLTEFILDKDPKAFDGFLKSAAAGATPGVIFTAAVPVVESFANKSLFRDRPIVPRSAEGLLPPYQYQPYNSELAKEMGKLIGTLPAVGDTKAASPAIIENFIRGWTGGLGMYLFGLADKAAREAGIVPDPVQPEDTLADIPFVKAFVVRFPSMGAEPIEIFYKRFDKQARTLKTAKALAKQGDEDSIRLLSDLSPAFGVLSQTRTALSAINKTVRAIHQNPQISPVEKRQLIDSAYYQAIMIAKFGNEQSDEIEKIGE